MQFLLLLIYISFIRARNVDFYVKESLDVQQQNLSTMQALNSIFDGLEAVHKTINNRSQFVFVSQPLQTKYNLKCFIRESSHNNISSERDSESLTEISARILPRRELCARQEIDTNVAIQAAEDVLHQISELAKAAGIHDIYEGSASPSTAMNRRNTGGTSHESIIEKAIRKRSFELLMTERRSRSNNIFSPLGHVGDRRGARTRDIFDIEVETFILDGHVFCRNSSVQQEVECVEKMRSFLSDFGALVRFELTSWRGSIFFLIDPSLLKYSFEKIEYGNPSKHTFLVEVPASFKPSMLLAFLGEHIPLCNAPLDI